MHETHDLKFDPVWFSDSYRMAREKFLALEPTFEMASVVHPLTGAEQETLAIDIAAYGTRTPQKTILVTTGLHGAEGYFGSAVLLGIAQWLQLSTMPVDMRVVLVHGLNPWGFSWDRRFDEQNIDNNRNFLLPGESYAGSPPMYQRLENWLNPRRVVSAMDWFYLEAVWKVVRHGMGPLKQAIAGGQYDFPQGLFYGGSQPSWTHQQVENHLADWTAGAKQVIHFDLHTGLGKYGTGACLLEVTPTANQQKRLEQLIPPVAIEQPVPAQQMSAEVDQTAYYTRGSLGRWCHQQLTEVDYLYGCLEFGTYPGIKMLKQLRRENACYHHSSSTNAKRREAMQLRECFCPADHAWREQTTATACQWIINAITLREDGR